MSNRPFVVLLEDEKGEPLPDHLQGAPPRCYETLREAKRAAEALSPKRVVVVDSARGLGYRPGAAAFHRRAWESEAHSDGGPRL